MIFTIFLLLGLSSFHHTVAVQRQTEHAHRSIARREPGGFEAKDSSLHPRGTAPLSLVQESELHGGASKLLPATSFVIGSSGVDTAEIEMMLSREMEDQVPTTPLPAAAAPVATAAVATAPVATAPAPLPAAAAPVVTAPVVTAGMVPAAAGATAAPLAVTAAPALSAAAVPAAPASPAVVAAPAPAASGGGGGIGRFIVMVLLVGSMLLCAVFAVRAKMQRPPPGRLEAVQGDGEDSHFWKSAKARQSFRKSQLHGSVNVDSDVDSETPRQSGARRPPSRDDRPPKTAQSASTTAQSNGGEDSGAGTESSNAKSSGQAGSLASSYKDRRGRSARDRSSPSDAERSAESPNKGREVSREPPAQESDEDNTTTKKESSYRGRRVQQQQAQTGSRAGGRQAGPAAPTSPEDVAV